MLRRCLVNLNQIAHQANSKSMTLSKNNTHVWNQTLVRKFSSGRDEDDNINKINTLNSGLDNLSSEKENIDSSSENYDIKKVTMNLLSEDSFGLKEVEENNIGPLPPKYERDPITGKFTGEEKVEISEEDKMLLSLKDDEILNMVEHRFAARKDWDEEEVAKNIQERKAALNVLGRKIPQQLGEEDVTTAPLTPEEFAAFKKYMKREKKMDIDEDDIPVQGLDANKEGGANTLDNDLAWLAKAYGTSESHWMEEITPYDLAPMKKVNRRDARPLPREILHHNNLELLRRYTTPGGQILNRTQSRLGAKDQRKIAKLVKRARALGLIPHVGQWKLEDKGVLCQGKDKLWWEEELDKRGLSLPKHYSEHKFFEKS